MADGVLIQGFTHDKDIKTIQIDDVTKALVVISVNHSDIHDGRGFNVFADFMGVAIDALVYYAFKTPLASDGKIIHLNFSQTAAPDASFLESNIYEKPDNDPVGGTDIDILNRNRTSGNTSTMQSFKLGSSIDLTGSTRIDHKLLNGINYSLLPLDLELVLKPDTWYIREIVNISGKTQNIACFDFWYENDNI